MERVSELEEEMRRCEAAHSGMQQDVDTKDHRIKVPPPPPQTINTREGTWFESVFIHAQMFRVGGCGKFRGETGKHVFGLNRTVQYPRCMGHVLHTHSIELEEGTISTYS